MPLKFWDEAFLTATYLINRTPTRILDFSTPFTCLFHDKPNYSSLRVFGCACWPNLHTYNKYKLQFRSKQCAFLDTTLFIRDTSVWISPLVVFIFLAMWFFMRIFSRFHNFIQTLVLVFVVKFSFYPLISLIMLGIWIIVLLIRLMFQPNYLSCLLIQVLKKIWCNLWSFLFWQTPVCHLSNWCPTRHLKLICCPFSLRRSRWIRSRLLPQRSRQTLLRQVLRRQVSHCHSHLLPARPLSTRCCGRACVSTRV